MPFEVGQVAGDYEILGILGNGGMGRVYRVRNTISNRVEAMKVLLPDLSAEPGLAERFIGEIRTVARLEHPNIAKLHTAFKLDNQLVMVMEFVEGQTLAERARQAPLPLDDVLSYTGQVLAALSYAHQNGVIHRDIKPSNIMVTQQGVVKLMDFGIAKSSAEPLLTRPGTTVGSMLYMSPEQVRGTAVDARSDLYSLGVVLYELTAGRRPFEADSTYGILDAQLNTPPKPPLQLNPSLPPLLNDVILTALAKDPAQRFQTAEAFRRAVETVQQKSTVQAPAGAFPPAAGKKSYRGLWMAAGALACLCVLAGAALLAPRFLKTSAHSAAPATTVAQAPKPAVQQPPVSNTPPPSTPVAEQKPNAEQVSRVAVPAPAVRMKHEAARPAPQNPVAKPPALQASAAPAATSSYPPIPSPAVQQPQPQQPAGPSQQELDEAAETLTKLQARADAVRSSLQRLREAQAAGGLELRQDMAAAASRLDSHMHAAEAALQSNRLDAAKNNMAHADEDLTKLEAFFGR